MKITLVAATKSIYGRTLKAYFDHEPSIMEKALSKVIVAHVIDPVTDTIAYIIEGRSSDIFGHFALMREHEGTCHVFKFVFHWLSTLDNTDGTEHTLIDTDILEMVTDNADYLRLASSLIDMLPKSSPEEIVAMIESIGVSDVIISLEHLTCGYNANTPVHVLQAPEIINDCIRYHAAIVTPPIEIGIISSHRTPDTLITCGLDFISATYPKIRYGRKTKIIVCLDKASANRIRDKRRVRSNRSATTTPKGKKAHNNKKAKK